MKQYCHYMTLSFRSLAVFFFFFLAITGNPRRCWLGQSFGHNLFRRGNGPSPTNGRDTYFGSSSKQGWWDHIQFIRQLDSSMWVSGVQWVRLHPGWPRSWLLHHHAGWPWTRHLLSLSLSFLISKVEIIMLLTLWGLIFSFSKYYLTHQL